jgi:AcrR family transcriptional regulator
MYTVRKTTFMEVAMSRQAPGQQLPPLPWQQHEPRPARSREPLTRDAIVDAALRVLDADGFDALTMRRVAQELDTGAASLYAHVANKDQLVDLVLDRVYGEFETPDPGPWQEQVKQLVRSGLRVMLAHPGLARATLAAIPMGPNGLALMEQGLAIARAAKVPDHIAAYVGELFGQYISVSAIEREANRERMGGDDPALLAEYARQFRDYLQSLPVGQYPNLAAMADALVAVNDQDERFELGLDIIVRGLASYASEDGGGEAA